MSKIEIIVKLILKSNFDACYLIIRFWDFSLRERHIWCEHALCLKQSFSGALPPLYTQYKHILWKQKRVFWTRLIVNYHLTALNSRHVRSLNWPELRTQNFMQIYLLWFGTGLLWSHVQRKINKIMTFFMIPPLFRVINMHEWGEKCGMYMMLKRVIKLYIYSFSRRFYTKQLTSCENNS